MDYGRLAYTGLGTITVGGAVLDQWALLGVAVGAVALGVALIRCAWRRGRSVGKP